MYGLGLFTGVGGITLALQEYVKPLAYCEIEPYCQSTLLQRMQEGNLPKAPIWDDVRTLPTDELPRIDIIYGGFPCQDISIAERQKGLEGERSGLFFEILRIIDETKAPFIFLENVPNIRTKGAERVCKELSERGYDCRWCMLSAADVGARHKRERWFLLAHSSSEERTRLPGGTEEALSPIRGSGQYRTVNEWQKAVSEIYRTTDGLPNRVDRIKALGNSVVPLQVKTAFEILTGLKKN